MSWDLANEEAILEQFETEGKTISAFAQKNIKLEKENAKLQKEFDKAIKINSERYNRTIDQLLEENTRLKKLFNEALDLLRNKDKWSHCDHIENFIKIHKQGKLE